MENPIKRWMNVVEVAEYLRCSPSKIYKQVAKHEIPYRKHGHDLLFGSLEIDTWILKQMVKPVKREPVIIATNSVDNL